MIGWARARRPRQAGHPATAVSVPAEPQPASADSTIANTSAPHPGSRPVAPLTGRTGPCGAGGFGGGSRGASAIIATPIGTLRKNPAPPRDRLGEPAPPTTNRDWRRCPAVAATTRPPGTVPRPSGNTTVSNESDDGATIAEPAPMPCSARAAISNAPVGAQPRSSDATANTASPATNTRRRPSRSPAVTRAAADRRSTACRRPAPTTVRRAESASRPDRRQGREDDRVVQQDHEVADQDDGQHGCARGLCGGVWFGAATVPSQVALWCPVAAVVGGARVRRANAHRRTWRKWLALSTGTGRASLPRSAPYRQAMDNRSEIREFLPPAAPGSPPSRRACPAYGGNRRVPGLRREEVAMLAGVSVDYYTRLERGNLGGRLRQRPRRARRRAAARRRRTPTSSTSPAPPSRDPPARTAPSGPVRASGSSTPSPAPGLRAQRTARRAGTNPLGRALYSPLFDGRPRGRNTARFLFLDPRARRLLRRLVRAPPRRRGDPARRGGPEPLRPTLRPRRRAVHPQRGLPHRWASHNVRFHRTGRQALHHPVVGDLDLTYEALDLTSTPD